MSSAFRDQLAADLQATFLNPDEFAEEHTIDGRKLVCMLDDNELLERKTVAKDGQHMDGLFLADKLLYLPVAEYGAPPKPGRMMELDGKVYRVVDVADECGLYSVYLEANRQ